jgi:hypothetical protein
MVPENLQWHLYIKHANCKGKPVKTFEHKCDGVKHSHIDLISVIKGKNGNANGASYRVSYQTGSS